MSRTLLHGQIHGARVTSADLHYVGSITVDALLLEAAGILSLQHVQVVDLDNGNRLETYTITGPPGSGVIQLNGAAARLVQPGDRVSILAYAAAAEGEAASRRPRVVLVDEDNRVARVVGVA
jgi:aspartate 1-decarboxylase